MLARTGFPSLLEEISGNPSGWQDKKAGKKAGHKGVSHDWCAPSHELSRAIGFLKR
jgi:hypothetical protein